MSGAAVSYYNSRAKIARSQAELVAVINTDANTDAQRFSTVGSSMVSLSACRNRQISELAMSVRASQISKANAIKLRNEIRGYLALDGELIDKVVGQVKGRSDVYVQAQTQALRRAGDQRPQVAANSGVQLERELGKRRREAGRDGKEVHDDQSPEPGCAVELGRERVLGGAIDGRLRMTRSRLIKTTESSGSTPVLVEGVAIHTRYERLRSALESQTPGAAALFAEPVLGAPTPTGFKSAAWYGSLTGELVPLAELSGVEHADAVATLRASMEELARKFADELLGNWLRAAFIVAHPDSILVAEKRVLLVNWGLGAAQCPTDERGVGATIPPRHRRRPRVAGLPSAIRCRAGGDSDGGRVESRVQRQQHPDTGHAKPADAGFDTAIGFDTAVGADADEPKHAERVPEPALPPPPPASPVRSRGWIAALGLCSSCSG